MLPRELAPQARSAIGYDQSSANANLAAYAPKSPPLYQQCYPQTPDPKF